MPLKTKTSDTFIFTAEDDAYADEFIRCLVALRAAREELGKTYGITCNGREGEVRGLITRAMDKCREAVVNIYGEEN